MMIKKNEHEITYYKNNSFIDIYSEIRDIYKQFANPVNVYPKCYNYMYIISGDRKIKNRISIKLDDGKLFLRNIIKERQSEINEDTQHYFEYFEEGNKWNNIEDYDITSWFSQNHDSYIYFSDKISCEDKALDFSIRGDNTFFIDTLNMKIVKQVQYMEFESCNNDNVHKHLTNFDRIMHDVYGFQPIDLKMSKIEICKSIKECKLQQDKIKNFNAFLLSVFNFIYYHLCDA